jgi:hypothetical protein
MVRAASLPGAARNPRDVARVCEFEQPRLDANLLTRAAAESADPKGFRAIFALRRPLRGEIPESG